MNHPKSSTPLTVALTAISLALLLVATYLLALRRYVWDAALVLVLSLAGLTIALLRPNARGRAGISALLKSLLPHTWAGWGRWGALFATLLVALVARARPASAGFSDLFLLWCGALAVFAAPPLATLLHGQPWRASFSKAELRALVGLLLAALLVRGVGLGRIPANLGGDEGTQLLDGLLMMRRPVGNPFATGWYSVPTMSFFVYGLAMRLFGATMAGGRALSVLAGTATVLTTLLLARELGGKRAGWVAALVMAFSSYHIHFSRLASNQIFDPLVGTLAIWLLWRGLQSRDLAARGPAFWALAGLVAGLGWYVYFGARWVSFLIALILGWRALREPRFLWRHRRGLALFVLGALIAALPLLAWYAARPHTLTERYNAVSIFASGWLSREVEITGKSAPRLLLEQFLKSASAFHLTPDPTFWYYPQMPLVDFVTGALMVVGLLYSLARLHWPSRGLTHLWFWSTLVMAWVLTENPPSSQRGLLLMPAAALLVAWGVEGLWRALKAEAQYATIAFTMLAGMLVILNLGFYFGTYTPRRTYGNPTAEIATEVARFVDANPHPACTNDDPTACPAMVYFYGPPTLYWEFGSLAFLLHDVPGQNVMIGGIPEEARSPARFVFVPERLGEVDAVTAAYPGGMAHTLTAPGGRTLALIYDWNRE